MGNPDNRFYIRTIIKFRQTFAALVFESIILYAKPCILSIHRRRMKTEAKAKAKVVASVWGQN